MWLSIETEDRVHLNIVKGGERVVLDIGWLAISFENVILFTFRHVAQSDLIDFNNLLISPMGLQILFSSKKQCSTPAWGVTSAWTCQARASPRDDAVLTTGTTPVMLDVSRNMSKSRSDNVMDGESPNRPWK